MKPTQYFVGYKDSPKSKLLYFGPFVSESVSDFFLASLPTPRKGGWTAVRHLQPFSVQEGRTVAEMILRDRQRQSKPDRRKSVRVVPSQQPSA